MEIERLREVRHLQREIEDLGSLRECLYYPVGSPRMSNGTHSSTPSNPTERAVNALLEVDEKIFAIQNRLAKEVSEILDWLYNEVESSEMRSILICHYLEGMTWEQTTRHVLGYFGTDSARMRVYRFFGCNNL